MGQVNVNPGGMQGSGVGPVRYRSKLAQAAVYALIPIGFVALPLLFIFPIVLLPLALLFVLLGSFAFIWPKSKWLRKSKLK